MSQQKWTPGPWSMLATNPPCIILNGSAGYELRDAMGGKHHATLADARLIAAAPELYEALEEILAKYELHGERLRADSIAEIARAALAKARGK